MKKIRSYVFQQHFTYHVLNSGSFRNVINVILFIFYGSLLFCFSFFHVNIPFSARICTPQFLLFFVYTSSIIFHFCTLFKKFVPHQVSSVKFDPLYVYGHAPFIRTFTSPCSMHVYLFFQLCLFAFQLLFFDICQKMMNRVG